MAIDSSGASTEAWVDLLDALRRAGDAVSGAGGAENGNELAEGYRFLLRLLAAGSDMFVEEADSGRPRFTRMITPTRKLFADNPDTDYDAAPVNGHTTYRIRGRRGTAHYLAMLVNAGSRRGQNRISANLSDRDMVIADDGTFEVTLTAERPSEATNWLALDPDATSVVVRQYFLDRATEVPAEYTIDAEPTPGAPPLLSDDYLARRLRGLAGFVENASSASAATSADLARRPNEFAAATAAADVAALFPTPDNNYVSGWFSIGEGEALVIEGRPPRARYWSLMVMSRWLESFDYRHHRVSLNSREVELEPDGTFRIVLASADPGVANWIDTAGHRQGAMTFRWMQAEAAPVPTCTVVQSR